MRFSCYKASVAMACAAAIVWGAAAYAAEQPAAKEAPANVVPEAVLKQTKPIFDGKTLDGWIQVPADSWTVKDGAMASTGAGLGVIYTKEDYTKYRLFFTMRHVSGNPDHQACFLICGARPE